MAQQTGSQTAGPPPPASLAHPDRTFWRDRVDEWYPRWRERTYFVPPVYMCRTDHDVVQLGGEDVKVSKPPVTNVTRGAPPALQESEMIEDQTQQRVLHCLRKLSEVQKEPMFVLSNLRFEDYLNEPCYAAAARTLPRPVDLKKQNQHRGDFDVLIVHRHYGILACEIKSVGFKFSSLSLTEQQQLDQVEMRVQQAVKQLEKSGVVLSHVMSDMQRPPRIARTLMLPNVSAAQLKQVLDICPQLEQDLRQSLEIEANEDPIPLCVTSDQLSGIANPHDVTDDIIQQLTQWWQARMCSGGMDTSMSDDSYLELLARFSGPATTVQVFCSVKPRLSMDVLRTEGEGVSETGDRFTQIMLTPQQLAVQHRSEPLALLVGPPGVGKTLMLVIKAFIWLRRRLHVQVIITCDDALAACHSVMHQIQQTVGPADAQRLHLHQFDFRVGGKQECEAAVSILAKIAKSQPTQRLYVIVDETVYQGCFEAFINALYQKIPNLHLWATSVEHQNRPALLTQILLTQPLRSPPSITRQVQLSRRIRTGFIYDYMAPTCPPPCDGPASIYLYHRGTDHDAGVTPRDCLQCGLDLSRMLREDLHVGVAVSGRPIHVSPPPLQPRDVFILSNNELNETDDLVIGLRRGGLPVFVMPAGDPDAAADVGTAALNEVVVADFSDVQGLERKVVVWVAEKMFHEGGGRGVVMGEEDEEFGRLFAVSRCTAQFVCVTPDKVDDDDDDDGGDGADGDDADDVEICCCDDDDVGNVDIDVIPINDCRKDGDNTDCANDNSHEVDALLAEVAATLNCKSKN